MGRDRTAKFHNRFKRPLVRARACQSVPRILSKRKPVRCGSMSGAANYTTVLGIDYKFLGGRACNRLAKQQRIPVYSLPHPQRI